MAELKIKADSGGGTVSFKGPATTTSNAAVQLTLPVDDGTSGQYLKTDGSGALSWSTISASDATKLPLAGGTMTGTISAKSIGIAANSYVYGSSGLDLYGDGSDNAAKLVQIVDGNIKLASAKGIDFSATANGATDMSSELLDDYEEGEFDAVMKNGVTLHGTVENMQYTKIGRQVTITGEFRVDSDNSNSDLYIDNLPFASTAATDSGSMAASACVTHDHNFGYGAAVFAYIMEGSNDIRFVELQDNGGYANASADSGAYYCLSITYFTSS